MHSAPMEVLVTVAVLNLNLLPAMNYRENVVKLALGDVGQSAHALDVEKVAVLTQGIRIAKSALQAEQVKIFDLERKLAHAEDDVRHLKEEIQSQDGGSHGPLPSEEAAAGAIPAGRRKDFRRASAKPVAAKLNSLVVSQSTEAVAQSSSASVAALGTREREEGR